MPVRSALGPSGGGAVVNGYRPGPMIPAGAKPWPILWEQDPRIDDGHAHEWERCLLVGDGQRRWRTEWVVRCVTCHAPRCGHSDDPDPCMERRHHDSLHIYLSGRFEPLGGLLLAEGDES